MSRKEIAKRIHTLFGRPAYAFDEKGIVVFTDARFDGPFYIFFPFFTPSVSLITGASPLMKQAVTKRLPLTQT